jgi:hypothetical protein
MDITMEMDMRKTNITLTLHHAYMNCNGSSCDLGKAVHWLLLKHAPAHRCTATPCHHRVPIT